VNDDPADRWERLRTWVQRKIAQMEAGDFERLPESFAADGGQVAREAYGTLLVAMEVIEGRRARGTRSSHPPREGEG